MTESAFGYMLRYLSIPVRTIGTTRVVAVRKYKSGDVWNTNYPKLVYADLRRFLKKEPPYAHHDHGYTGEWFSARDHPSQVIYMPEGRLHNCFNGKGTAEAFGKALQLIDYYLMKADLPLKTLGWSRAVTLQEFADYYLGLDCNGFVGSYFAASFPGSTIGPDTHCNDYDNAAHLGVKRMKLSEIRARDVLVREGAGGTRHVALIDSVTLGSSGDTVSILLVQSASSEGGLCAANKQLKWLKAPAVKKAETQSVISVDVLSGYEFNYAIGFPFAA